MASNAIVIMRDKDKPFDIKRIGYSLKSLHHYNAGFIIIQQDYIILITAFNNLTTLIHTSFQVNMVTALWLTCI